MICEMCDVRYYILYVYLVYMVQQLKGEIDFNKRRQAIADKLPPVKSGFFTMKEGMEGMEGIKPASIDQKKRTDRNKHNIDIAEIGRQGVSGLAYAVGFLLVFQVVGFNAAAMLARYRYYVLHEKKEGAGGSGGTGGPAFLGINEVDDNKETVFSETYCTGGTGGTGKKSDFGRVSWHNRRRKTTHRTVRDIPVRQHEVHRPQGTVVSKC